MATLKVPERPLVAVHVPVSRSLSTGAFAVTTTPSQSRPVDTNSAADTVHIPVTLQYNGFSDTQVNDESASDVTVVFENP